MACPGVHGEWWVCLIYLCEIFIPKIVHRHFWHMLNNPVLRAIFGEKVFFLFFWLKNQLGQGRRRWVRDVGSIV